MAEEQNMTVQEEVSDRILTVPNVITFIRLLMIPVAFVFLVSGNNIVACILFATAAATDFLDGQIARRTHCVTKLGQLLDPAVDRLLMVAGVLGLLITGLIPVWVVVLVVVRDLYLLCGGAYLLKRHQIRVPVIYPGKFATTFLFVGFAGLMLNTPILQGLGIVNVSWLPGLSADPYCWGIWFIYLGLLLAIGTTVYYTVAAVRALKQKGTC